MMLKWQLIITKQKQHWNDTDAAPLISKRPFHFPHGNLCPETLQQGYEQGPEFWISVNTSNTVVLN